MITLHGFLGHPKDFDFLSAKHLSLFSGEDFQAEKGLWIAGKKVNALASSLKRDVLLGYSLGGRIALHALIDSPMQWKAAVIVSSHTGLDLEKEKKSRYQKDQHLAKRFLNDPWDQVIHDWNQQPIFSHPLLRKEKHFSRQALASALIGWSLGKQEDLTFRIQEIHLPILWITGSKDKKFTSIAERVKLRHPLSEKVIIQDASHRVPWEKQLEFTDTLGKFFQTLKRSDI